MSQEHRDAVRRFCDQVGHPDIFSYLGVERGATIRAREQALSERRERAQRQPPDDAEAASFLSALSAIEALVLRDPRTPTGAVRPNPSAPLDARRFPKQHEVAADFCEHVGAESLHAWLHLNPGVTAEELAAALQQKRKWAQGQQNNPKHGREAMVVIRDFGDLAAALAEPALHLECVAHRREQRGLPQLRMTMQAMADSGAPLTPELLTSIETMAEQLGVGGGALQALITQSFGHFHPNTPVPPLTAPRPRQRDRDPLTLDREAPTAPRRPALADRPLLATPPVQKERSPREEPVRSDFEPRVGPPTRGLHPATTSAPTAPPVRREFRPPGPTPASPPRAGPDHAARRATPGPVDRRANDPASTLRHGGQSTFSAVVYTDRAVIAEPRVEFVGAMPPAAEVRSAVPWLQAWPDRLDPVAERGAKVQSFTVTAVPSLMPAASATGEVLVQNSFGESLTYQFAVERRYNWASLLRGVGLSVAVAAMVILTALALQHLLTPGYGELLTIRIDPSSDVVLLDGDRIGAGPVVQVARPRIGTRRITAALNNFASAERDVVIRAGDALAVDIVLDLTAPLTFTPTANDTRADAPSEAEAQTRSAIGACLERLPPDHSAFAAELSVFVLRDGSPGGVHLRGRATPEVERCVRRQVAAQRYAPLTTGDFVQVVARFQHP
jgi:hypothetical protein